MDVSKRCLSCGFNGDGHYTHCIVPYKEEAKKILESMRPEQLRTLPSAVSSILKRIAGEYIR